jgi:hypothetical protein
MRTISKIAVGTMGLILVAGCRGTKPSTSALSGLESQALSNVSARSETATAQPVEANLAGYLPNKNEIDEPVDDYPTQSTSSRGFGNSSRASGGSSGCQGGCCR